MGVSIRGIGVSIKSRGGLLTAKMSDVERQEFENKCGEERKVKGKEETNVLDRARRRERGQGGGKRLKEDPKKWRKESRKGKGCRSNRVTAIILRSNTDKQRQAATVVDLMVTYGMSTLRQCVV